jgi:hypothetical protein
VDYLALADIKGMNDAAVRQGAAPCFDAPRRAPC